jgi:hypothetical protein
MNRFRVRARWWGSLESAEGAPHCLGLIDRSAQDIRCSPEVLFKRERLGLTGGV